MTTDMHPYAFLNLLGPCHYEAEGHAQTASYAVLDEEEEGRLMGMAEIKERTSRQGERQVHDVTAQVINWRRSGHNVIIVGPETTGIIKQRLKNNDVPTAPVPPAYIQFSDPFLNYGPSLKLHGAYLYRGRLGRITFLNSDETVTPDQRTVYLPSVFRNKALDNLKNSMFAEKNVRHPDIVKDLAKNLLQYDPMFHSEEDLRIAENHIASLSGIAADMTGIEGDTETLQDLTDLEKSHEAFVDKDYFIDVSMINFNNILGSVQNKSNPLQPKAARAVLIAADEARKFDETYGKPQYINTNPATRNQFEDTDCEVETQNNPIILP